MRLFLALTDELGGARAVVEQVVDALNRVGGVPRFELADWSAWAAEQMGGERTPLVRLEPGDVFVGAAWLRFAAPSAEDLEPGTGAPPAGAEEDFELAFRSSASSPGAASLFYRCMELPARLADVSGEQLARVERFFARFQSGRSPGRYGEYASAAELGERLAADLEEARRGFLAARREVTRREAASPVAREVPAESLPEYAKKMQPGKAYEVSFLVVEIAGFADLAGEQEAVDALQRSFKQLVLETAASYGGEIFSWDAERGRGVLIFWARRSYDHAIITGLKVIHGLPVFNLDPLQNPLGTPLEIRTAAHDAVIVFRLPTAEIASSDLDFVLALAGQHTGAGELIVTRRLVDRADPRLKARFKSKGRIDGEPIFGCRLPSTEQHALRASLDEVSRRLKAAAAAIKSRLAQPAGELAAAAVEAISAGVDEGYAQLERACRLLGKVDASWSKKFYGDLAGMVHVLVREEDELWMVLRRGYGQHRQSPEIAARLETLVKAASSLRSRPAATLSQAEQRLRAQASDEVAAAAAEPVDEELSKKIHAFLRADPLDYETLLTDMLLHSKTALIHFLTRSREEKTYEAFLNRLWESADLLLIDDLYSIRGHQRAGETKLFDVLVHEPVADGRFQVTRQLLREEFRPAEELVRRRFQQLGLEIENRDLQVVWRAVVVGHPAVKIRTLAALKMSPFSMWQAIAHPSVPIASIHAIGERVTKSEGEDAKKIFFDCVRARVVEAVETFRTRDELAAITKLILLLLDFPFLVETGYFERFDDVLERFLARSGQLNLEVEYFVNLRQRLDKAKRDPDAAKANRPPAGITKLPLTIQRRLAAEKPYLYWFVTHPDPRIATETLRHVTLGNVERVLRAPEINGVVMAQLMKKPELFTRSGPLLAALNNPKCDLGFANRYLNTMSLTRASFSALEKLSRNPSANPAVRSLAARLVAQRKQHPAP
ncbi:MAG TPA: hypothetical protein VGG06_31630 [Thermoanaerobaculia bacterium]|jgi:hypothetical protein